jgi:thioredoxin 1
MPVSHLAQADDDSLDHIVLSEASPVLVQFYSPWCGHCRRMAPIIDEVSQEYAGRFRFIQLDATKNPGSVERYRIRGVPTMLIFARGREVDRIVGELPRDALQARVTQALPKASSEQ